MLLVFLATWAHCPLMFSRLSTNTPSDGEKQSEISTHSSVVLLTSFVGVLPVTGEEDETDDVNSFDVETVSEGPGKASAGVQLPAANRPRVCAWSIPGERGNGVLPVAGAELVIEDVNSFDVETVSEGLGKALAGTQLPAANRPRVCAWSIPGERGNGVLPVTGEEDETDDVNSFDVETVSEGPGKALAGVQLPAANRPGVCALSIPGERGNGVLPAAGAEQELDDDSFTENEGLSSLEVSAGDREEFQLKKDASTQGDDQVYSQRWVKQLQQELANALKKNSLAEASLEAKKHYSRHLQEQKLQLQKELDRSKAKLQELTERHMRTECYAESLKNAIKNKERELTTSRNLQGLLAASSGTAAIPELEERIQWLQAGKVRLEATAQQQAKTIKALQKHLQASASAHNGLKDLTIGFQTTRAPMDYQHRQRGSESKEVKKVAEMKCRTEALLREMQGRNSALEEECTRLKMLLEGSRAKLMAYVGRASHLRFRAEMRKSSSEVAKQVYKLRRKSQLNLQHGQ
ncbi:uncharacterized protein LOC142055792 [Phalacrocorax aristotelis]|uniref:uncharacterized protein LOC142055792 n=1 Tax=Phalacrocorax aristotelis TaxID=126867 RepID=UPI003F4B2D3F